MRRVTVLLLAMLMSGPSLARSPGPVLSGQVSGHDYVLPDQVQSLRLQLARGSISAGEAAARARSVYPGRVLSISRAQSGGRTYYKVKILTRRGAVRVVYVDAQTGSVQ